MLCTSIVQDMEIYVLCCTMLENRWVCTTRTCICSPFIVEQIRLARLSYVIYEHPSLEIFSAFAKDFGFIETESNSRNEERFYHGYGVDPFVYVAREASGGTKRFVGAGFVAESAEDFKRASTLEGAKNVAMNEKPGGGQAIVLSDPNGFEMVIAWGQEPRTPPEHGVSALQGHPPVNGALDKRRKGTNKLLLL